MVEASAVLSEALVTVWYACSRKDGRMESKPAQIMHRGVLFIQFFKKDGCTSFCKSALGPLDLCPVFFVRLLASIPSHPCVGSIDDSFFFWWRTSNQKGFLVGKLRSCGFKTRTLQWKLKHGPQGLEKCMQCAVPIDHTSTNLCTQGYSQSDCWPVHKKGGVHARKDTGPSGKKRKEKKGKKGVASLYLPTVIGNRIRPPEDINKTKHAEWQAGKEPSEEKVGTCLQGQLS
eukprot:1162056-Pelagomonas_calceolata.AAC.1